MTSSKDTTEEEIWAECSDEEEFSKLGIRNGSTWAPKLEEVEGLYQQVKNNKFIEFAWKCPGRRDPNQPEPVKSEPQTPVADTKRESEANDFDFEEDAPTAAPTKLPAKTATPKSTGKKRTTTLAGILSNMERHRIIERLDASSDDPKDGKTKAPTPKST